MLLRRRVWRHPLYVWLLWAGAVTVLAVGPMVMLSDPALLPLLLDPELLALIIITGVQYTRLEINLLCLRTYAGLRRRR